MKQYRWVILNISFILLFYIARCLIMNLNILFSLVLLGEVAITVFLLLKLLIRKYRTQDNLIRSTIHIAGIWTVLFLVGHLVSISALYLAHHRTVQVFKKHQEDIPIGDRMNGSWILNEDEFVLNNEDRDILVKNYAKLSPCYYYQGYCYFQLGGFLRNSGGYCLKINESEDREIGSFRFHRINETTRLVGNWMYYE